MKTIITLLLFSISFIAISQDKNYRIYLKDGTSVEVKNASKVSGNINFESLDGSSGFFASNKVMTVRMISTDKDLQYAPVKFQYCELIGIDNRKLFSIKPNLNVIVDYGDISHEFDNGYIIDEKSGKALTFSTMVEAMNYMGQNGWEFVQAYTVSEPSGGQVYRWLLKRTKK
jgi:hypothetical protein